MGDGGTDRGRSGWPKDRSVFRNRDRGKVLGDIEVGANARVGVNAVVLDYVPPNTTVVGIPATRVRLSPHPFGRRRIRAQDAALTACGTEK